MRLLLNVAALTVLLGALILAAGGCGGGSESAARSTAQDSRIFDVLDQYGVWIDIPEFGTVWRPNVSPEWRPYTYGHWTWSDEGWIWLGYEPFAWVVYHYGSWYEDHAYGWVWVPAYDWTPAPVAWATTDDYIAWAPLPPQGASLMQPGDPYWDQMWVVVPIDHFRQEDVGKYNIAKDPQSGGRVRGGTRKPPDEKRLAKARETALKVDFDKVPAERGELLRLKLPSYEDQVVRAHTEEFDRTVLKSTGQHNAVPAQNHGQPEQAPARTPVQTETPRDQTPAVSKPAQQHQKVDEPASKPVTPARKHEKAKTEGTEKKHAPAPKTTPQPKPQEEKKPTPKNNPN